MLLRRLRTKMARAFHSRKRKHIWYFSFFILILLGYHCYHLVRTKNSNQTMHKKVALFIQARGLNDPVIFNDILQCVENVGKAKQLAQNFELYPWVDIKPPQPFQFDIFLAYPKQTNFSLISRFKGLGAAEVHVTPISNNDGLDIKEFLSQLKIAESKSNPYHYFLKIHSKSDGAIRRHIFESLCGSAAQVLTVLGAFQERGIGVVTPLGLVIKQSVEKKRLHKAMRELYNVDLAFSEKNVRNMQLVYKKMMGRELDGDREKYLCNTGTMFWSRYRDFQVKDWVRIMPWLATQWTSGYVNDGGIEHAMERLFTTIPYLHNVTVAELGPAVKPMGIYFPQFHQTQVNDDLHGKGFTEWTLLKPSTVDFLAKPLPVTEGGLGYYDLNDVEIRRKQGELAKAAGLHGFMYYHYWFASEGSNNYTNPVLGKVPELMLKDGHPDIPFMFSWANEPWTNTWSGKDGKILLPQNYGGEEDWKEHFFYLLPFFKHHNYITVEEKPVFIIYRVGHMHKVLEPMLTLWRNLAEQSGLKGLHIMFTLNNFTPTDKVFEQNLDDHCDSSFQFFPTLKNVYHIDSSSSISEIKPNGKRQYWGAFTSFVNVLRRQTSPTIFIVSPSVFKQNLAHSFKKMLAILPLTEIQISAPNLFFITAWNEWNEQAVLEPSDKYGFSYLSAVKDNLENQPMLKVE